MKMQTHGDSFKLGRTSFRGSKMSSDDVPFKSRRLQNSTMRSNKSKESQKSERKQTIRLSKDRHVSTISIEQVSEEPLETKIKTKKKSAGEKPEIAASSVVMQME